MKTINSFYLSGRLTADARIFEGKTGKVARFSIAHNFGPGQQAIFVDAVMFSKTGAKDTPIPENLLKKGTPVQLCGFFRPAKPQEGKKYCGFDLVVASCDPLEDESVS